MKREKVRRTIFHTIFSIGLIFQIWSLSYSQVRYTMLICMALCCLATHTGLAQIQYDVVDIVGQGDSSVTTAVAISNDGHIIGQAGSSKVIWYEGTTTPILVFSNILPECYGVSDGGNVVGRYRDVSGKYRAFLWIDGIATDLGTLGGQQSFARSINGSGQIVGTSDTGMTLNHSMPFLYQNGIMTSLQGLPGAIAYAEDARSINDAGVVAGVSNFGPQSERAVIWVDGIVSELVSQFQVTYALDINNGGAVVGGENDSAGIVRSLVWKNGNATNLGTLGGKDDEALAINDSGTIVGYSILANNASHAFIYENGVINDLNSVTDTSGGWVLNRAVDINNKREIVGYGVHNGKTRAFLLKPARLRISRPLAGELWIAGETDTITWKANGIASVDLLLSTDYHDGAGAFNEIVHSYPADSGRYIWHLPDTILSRKCAIQIEDTAIPDTFAISDSFRIKPYVLTRVDSNGDYEPYKIGPTIGEDDWIFNNTEANMFPPSWYGQFDYVNGTDPFTHSHYTYDFQFWLINAHPKDFPDWPSFVRAFGTDQCYFTLSFGGFLKPMAIFYWALMKGSWGGSCYGFASSSFLAFDRKSDFISRFGISQFGNLRDVQAGDTTRKVINEIFTYQYGTEGKGADLGAVITRPNETLQEIKQMFRSENGDNRHIDFFDYTSSAGHSVAPWKISKRSDHPELEYIQVYDNNYPDMDNLAFEIDTIQNTWSYPTIAPGTTKLARSVHLSNLTGSTHKSVGLVLSLPSSSFLHDANIPFTPSGARTVATQSLLSLYNSSNASIKMTNSSGDSIVYHSKDSSLIVGIATAVPNISLTGNPHPPIGYDVPMDSYSISMSDFTDSLTYFSAFANGRVIYAGRRDATSTETDDLSFDTGLGTRNRDTSSKKMNFGSIIAEPTLQKQIDVLHCTLVQNDSMRFASLNTDGFQLVNAGTSKDYDIDLRNVSASGGLRFTHAHILLDANSTHLISPLWDSLNTTSLKILIDNGNDGTVDDSIFVDNQVTGLKDLTSKGLPIEYALHQNYPNPFNPTTTISFDLPTQSYVTLKVYNMLGQEVAALVDGVRQAGRYTASMDGARLPSGVYFYQLNAGLYSAVKKMVILK